MALPGTGFRSVISVMLEMSYHLLEDVCFTSLTSAVSTTGSVAVIVGSLGQPRNACYIGAQLIVDSGNNQEIVTVTNVNPAASSFTASFIFPHAIGAQVQGATFPVQASSGDYFFSQSEILNYIARGQNEFIARVPCIFALNTQFVQFGQIYQQLICDAVEMHHASSSAMYVTLVSLTRTGIGGYGAGGYGAGGYGEGGLTGTVVAVSQSPHGLVEGQKFSIFNTPDTSFVGAFTVGAVTDDHTWNYVQDKPDATTYGGAAVLWLRLYLTSQEELSIQDPFWRNQNITRISSVFEDRTGNYRFGVNGKPSTNLPLEVLVSIRDTDSLSMTDGLLLPDPIVPACKWRALSYCFGKDGEQRDAMRQKFCDMQFERWILATQRWMSWAGIGIESTTSQVSMAGQGRGR